MGGDIADARLRSQRISHGRDAASPEEVLASLGAVQAQDYHAALWAIGLRCGGSTSKDDVEAAVAKRRISRTWLMRGTLHFASSRDIHWMLRLFAPRLVKTAIARDRHLGLGDDVVRKAEDLFAEALKGSRQLTRGEMYKVLEKGGVEIAGELGYHMLYRAAWDGVICFGAHSGRQPTFELLYERIAERRELSDGEALAELASRYFTSHGPATVRDYVWWSGLKTSDARRGIEAASRALASEEMDGKAYYMAKDQREPGRGEPRVHLLPAFDEYIVAYSDRSAVLGDEETQRMLGSGKIVFTHSNGIFLPVVVADGAVVGTWKRNNAKGDVGVTVRPFARFDRELTEGVEEAAGRYGRFLGDPVSISFER